MEGGNRRASEKSKEKSKVISKEQCTEEKKTRSDTTHVLGFSKPEQDVESIVVIGKSCNPQKTKAHEAAYNIHGCQSESALYQISQHPNTAEDIPCEGSAPPFSSLSCASFISAKSDVSNDRIMEDDLSKKNIGAISSELSSYKHASPLHLGLTSESDYVHKLKDMERKIAAKEKKIKELNSRLEDYKNLKTKKTIENRDLTHQINALNRQLQSMYELVGQKSWNKTINPIEFLQIKNRAAELESLNEKLCDENRKLKENVQSISFELNLKEKEFNSKNRTTSEMCKLINKIDSSKGTPKTEFEECDNKITQAQIFADDQLLETTTKLEVQYQKDLKSAIEKIRSYFDSFAPLPPASVEGLSDGCESPSIDLLPLGGKQLTTNSTSMDYASFSDEINTLRDSYEKKVQNLNEEIEYLSGELREKKRVIEILESDLQAKKENSQLDMLRSIDNMGNYFVSLRELYTAEITAEKKIHELEADVFEKKVKALSDEILYRAKNEENHLEEVNKARKTARIYREKYENLMLEWTERIQQRFENLVKSDFLPHDLDDVFQQINDLMACLKKAEIMYENRVEKMAESHENDLTSYKNDIEIFKAKINEMEVFQSDQVILDATIQDLIENVAGNYIKTVEALVTSHTTEINLKQLEMQALEKRYTDEIESLKSLHVKQVEDLDKRLQTAENRPDALQMEEMSLKLIKYEGMLALKEETENALVNRIKDLENSLESQRENCRKQSENFLIKLLGKNAVFSAQEDLLRELEDKLNESGKLFGESYGNMEVLRGVLTPLTGDFTEGDEGELKQILTLNDYCLMKRNRDQLQMELNKTFDKMQVLEKEISSLRCDKRALIDAERLFTDRTKALEGNVVALENEKAMILTDKEKTESEKESLLKELQEKDEFLKTSRKDLETLSKANEHLVQVEAELKGKLEALLLEKAKSSTKWDRGVEGSEGGNGERSQSVVEMENMGTDENKSFSGSHQRVRVLYEEESLGGKSVSTSSVGCQAVFQSPDFPEETCLRDEERCLKDNDGFKCGIKDEKREHITDSVLSLRKDLSEMANERNGWMAICQNLQAEKKRLKEELENTREENLIMSTKLEAQLKILQREVYQAREESAFGIRPWNKEEMTQLNGSVKVLTAKLDDMKRTKEKLVSESLDHLRKNPSLTSELEDAWAQRSQVEDRLTKVRRENALLNLHRSQLEDTNRRISDLITESRPSVASWMKIHETVEGIVDEVLALKTSFGESEQSELRPRTPRELPSETPSELKLMSERLHAQLLSQGKTIPCDRLLVQKKSLESELRDLEKLLKENDSRILTQGRVPGGKRPSVDLRKKKSKLYRFQIDETHQKELMSTLKMYGESHYNTLTLVKKHVESRPELDEPRFYDKLKYEIQDLKKEVQQLQMNIELKRNSLEEMRTDEERDLTLIEIRYEEEVLELMKEFEKEVDKLRSDFTDDSLLAEEWEEEAREKYICEIDKIREYFGKRHQDLEKKYYEIHEALDKKREKGNCALEEERQRVINCFQKILQTKEGKLQETELENFLNGIVNKYVEEIKTLRNRYKENLIEHASEIESLQSVITKLRENVACDEEEMKKKERTTLESVRLEYEKKLERETKELKQVIQELKEQHRREVLEREKHWTCEFCKGRKSSEDRDSPENLHIILDKTDSENEKCLSDKMLSNKSSVDLNMSLKEQSSPHRESDALFRFEGQLSESRNSISYLPDNSYFGDDGVKTDDDKLDIVKERDSLKEMVFSLRKLVTKLLNFMSQPGKDGADDTLKEFDGEDTLYKSMRICPDDNPADYSIASQLHWPPGPELSTIIHEINNHSLLNSSEHQRLELDKCLSKLKEDAFGLLSLSNPEGCRRLAEMVKKIEEDKNSLQERVRNMEAAQVEMKEEVEATKEKLANWERNLEVVSEGYGEEVIESKKPVIPVDVKGKMKMFLSEVGCVPSSQDTIFLEEIYKEGYLWEEEWKKEKFDLQQQIDVADKQLHSLRKFMEEQAAERELEREAFDKEINHLKESLKNKERDNVLHNRTNQEIDALESQIKELTSQMENLEQCKSSVESEFQTAVKKIWTLREVIQDLEAQLAESNERESLLKRKMENLDDLVKDQAKINSHLKEELERCKEENDMKMADHLKNWEEERSSLRRIVDQINHEDLNQMKYNLRHIENLVIKKTKDLEQLHTSSANVSCSSPSEDVSIRDRFDATRCSTPDEMSNHHPQPIVLPLEEVDRLQEKLSRHTRAEEVALKCIKDLKMQITAYKKSAEEMLTERDVLLERIDLYLKENSSLKSRLEEQRCNASLQQKKLNADLESQIYRLETEWEKLNELCIQKDKQLHDMEKMLENTAKALTQREAEVLTKQKEENSLITTLKADLASALTEKETLENDLENVKQKLRASLKIPAVIDSVIEEKNAEIDRLEKEVSRLSNEKSTPEPSKIPQTSKKIKFSEPESFEDCLSTISPYVPSIIRNCSDSFTDFRNSSFRWRQPLQYSKELESVSSIGPLQLSPRGGDFNTNWKTSSPITAAEDSTVDKGPPNLNPGNKSADGSIPEEFQQAKKRLEDVNRELERFKGEKADMERNLREKEEEILRLKEVETNLTTTMELEAKKHSEEVDELRNKLNFERGKVEKVYGEIKELEAKKIDIEKAFYSLKEEYSEKSEREQKMAKVLVGKIKDLECQNAEAEVRLTYMKEEMETVVKEANDTMQVLYKELTEVKRENETLKKAPVTVADAEIQVEDDRIENLMEGLVSWIKSEGDSKLLRENVGQLKLKLFEISEVLVKDDGFTRKDVSAYLLGLVKVLSCIFESINDLFTDLEIQRKKIMESSVDELAIKVQKELLLSAKLDNQLLSSIRAKNLKPEIGSERETVEEPTSNFPGENEDSCHAFVAVQEKEKVKNLQRENEELQEKVENHEKLIGFLEENLLAEKERITAEKERCKEDAKIMELLRVKLEKGLHDIKSKERDLRKEKQLRLMLEKEVEVLNKRLSAIPVQEKKNSAVQSEQEEKLTVLSQSLEAERKKGKDLKLMLEQEKLERISEKETQRLLETDLTLLKEQKENFKSELIKTKQLLHSRDKEINLLKRKINLQEIDIKALTLSNDFIQSRSSSVTSEDQVDSLPRSPTRHNSSHCLSPVKNSSSLLLKMKKLNNCVQRHVEDSNEMGETLLHLTEETEEMRDRIKKLEQSAEQKPEDDTLLADVEVERKLWDLERGKLLMDVETLKTENDIVKRDSIETYKRNKFLQLENSKLKAEIKLLEKEATSQIEMGMLRERIGHLLRKYLRAESYRKALIWQKQYLTINLNSYRTSEEEMFKKMGRTKTRRKEVKAKGTARFRILSLAVIAVFRMKYIVKRWQKPKTEPVLDPQHRTVQQNLTESVVNRAYTDPLNPLTYQTENLFRRTSSRVLRTPPSRDPGFTVEKRGVDSFANPATVQLLP